MQGLLDYMVRALVRAVFGKEPDVSQNPDEAVALGAVIQAGIHGRGSFSLRSEMPGIGVWFQC